jgi:iron complex transport system permease protein
MSRERMGGTTPSATAVDFGHRELVVRSKRGTLSWRMPRRVAMLSLICAGLALAIAIVALASGSYQLDIGQVVSALTGQATGITRTIVLEWRLPRVLLAALFGCALGLGGAIFQSLTRNPLGSPDIIGFDAGAYSGALLVMLVFRQGDEYSVTAGALIGGLATAAVVYLLAYRRGVHGFRLIIVGIGVSAMLTSLNTWLVLTASLKEAMTVAFWGAGSLNGTGYTQLVPAVIAFAVLFPAAFLLAPSMRALDLGDDAASQLGVRSERVRLTLVFVGVALTATVTALAGPIAFVALAAPQIARRLSRSAGISLGASAAVGCVLLLGADWIAQHAFPIDLPVGIVTVVLGGSYFVWLLIREARNA